MISYFVIGKPEILHLSQLRKAFRPRSQSVETQTLVAYGGVRQVKKMPFPHCVDLFYDMWKLIFVARNGGGIHREIIQHRRYSQTHHYLITDVLQLDNDTKKCWFLEEFVAANIMGIVGIFHMLSCKRTHSIWEFCFWHFDDVRCNVWAKVYEMAWSTLVFSSVFWDTWRPIRLGAPSHDDVWTGGHTQASGQAYAQNCVGFQMFSGFCNYKTEMSICNVIPATQNVL